MSNHSLILFSHRLLQAIRKQAAGAAIKEQEGISLNTLLTQLDNDDSKKAFWINLYNAWFQWLAMQGLRKNEIFTKAAVSFADIGLSLDDIEHGILRRFRWKYSLGYLPNLFCPDHIKRLAVERTDHRIHFALNCGAVSCPPIAFYDPTCLNEQLDRATNHFITAETTVNEETKIIHTSRLLAWFRADFRQAGGLRRFLGEVMQKDFSRYRLAFNAYRWDEKLMNFADMKQP